MLFVFARFLLGERPDQVRPVAVLSGEWEPFVGERLPDGGPVAQIMTDVLEGAGFEAHLSFTTWDMVDQRTAGGSAFGGFPLVGSEDRRARMLLSDPILAFDYVLYMRADAVTIPQTAEDLAQLRVGGVAGYDYWEALDSASELVTYPSTHDGFQALADGDIDVFAEGTLSAEASFADPTTDVERSMFQVVGEREPWARSKQELFFMMNKSREADRVMERVNASLAFVKETPEYAERIRSLEGGHADSVRIARSVDGPVDVVDSTGDLVGRAVAGSRARVLDWGDAVDPQQVRVKFSSGNLAGLIGYVDVANVEVE